MAGLHNFGQDDGHGFAIPMSFCLESIQEVTNALFSKMKGGGVMGKCDVKQFKWKG